MRARWYKCNGSHVNICKLMRSFHDRFDSDPQSQSSHTHTRVAATSSSSTASAHAGSQAETHLQQQQQQQQQQQLQQYQQQYQQQQPYQQQYQPQFQPQQPQPQPQHFYHGQATQHQQLQHASATESAKQASKFKKQKQQYESQLEIMKAQFVSLGNSAQQWNSDFCEQMSTLLLRVQMLETFMQKQLVIKPNSDDESESIAPTMASQATRQLRLVSELLKLLRQQNDTIGIHPRSGSGPPLNLVRDVSTLQGHVTSLAHASDIRHEKAQKLGQLLLEQLTSQRVLRAAASLFVDAGGRI
jgi:hypothetical protein